MRMQYYEDKRRQYTQQLEESVKRGILESVRHDESLPNIASRTMNSNQKSPRTAISKHTMNFVSNYHTRSPSALNQPDITLRDPLDKEFVLNRKMAKKHYERQLREKMSQINEQNFAERERKKKELFDREMKKEKDIAEQRKQDYTELKDKVTERRNKEEERRKDRQRKERANTNRILREAREEEKQRVERELKKTQDYN